jgi:esterase/lipase
MIALAAAAKYPLAGVVALSTPYFGYSPLVELSAGLLGLLGLSARKQAELHATLKERREAGYPAYARYPVRIIAELSRLSKAMRLSLPQVRVPCLVIQSHADMGGGDDLERIYASLGSTRKERLWLNDMDHSLVRDPKRQVVFDAIGKFIREINQT